MKALRDRRPLALTALVLAACSASPQTPDDPLADNAEWQTANAEMERYFEQTDLPDTLDVPADAMKFVVERKVAGYEEARQTFVDLFDTNDVTLRAAATLRVAQVEMNFGCDLAEVAPPATLPPESREMIVELMFEIAEPMLERSRVSLNRSSKMGDNGFSEAAAGLANDFPNAADHEGTRAYCAANRNAWYRPPSAPFDRRMKAQCDLGMPDACYVASLVSSDEAEAAKLAERACEAGIRQACDKPEAQQFDVLGSTPPPPTTCEEGFAPACWKEAAVVDPELLQTYTDYCFRGSGFDCLKRGMLLEGDDQLLKACGAGAVPKAAVLDDAREECDAGDARACFQLGVATYIEPRELESSRPMGGMMGVGGLIGRGDRTPSPSREALEEGCSAGRSEACVKLAATLPADSPDRSEAYKRACELDNSNGCYQWASALRRDKETSDVLRQEAMTALQKACRGGFDQACADVAVAFGKGIDLPQSKVCAARYLFEVCTPTDSWRCMSFNTILK